MTFLIAYRIPEAFKIAIINVNRSSVLTVTQANSGKWISNVPFTSASTLRALGYEKLAYEKLAYIATTRRKI